MSERGLFSPSASSKPVSISKYRKAVGPVPSHVGLWRWIYRFGFLLLPGRYQARLLYGYDFMDLLCHLQEHYAEYLVTVSVPLLPKYPCTWMERMVAMVRCVLSSRMVHYRLDLTKAHQLSVFLNPFFVGASNDLMHVNWILERSSDCVQYIDVGANVGTMSIPVAKLRPSLGVISLEPVPSNFDALSYNIALNRLSNVEAVQAAVTTSGCGTIRFNLNVFQDGGGGIDHRGHGTGGFWISDEQLATDFPDALRSIEVNAVSLDDLVDGKPSIVKIDAEGHDSEVLVSGLRSLEGRFIRHLIVEVDRDTLHNVYALLSEYFGKISYYNPNSGEIEPFSEQAELRSADLLCSL